MGTIGPDQITSLFVQDFIEAQNEIGLTPVSLAKSLKSLIKAKKTDTFCTSLGVVVYSKPREDNVIRAKALQMALNIRGVQTTSPVTSTVTMRNDPDSPLLIEPVNQEYLQRLAVKLAGGKDDSASD